MTFVEKFSASSEMEILRVSKFRGHFKYFIELKIYCIRLKKYDIRCASDFFKGTFYYQKVIKAKNTATTE